MNLSQADIDDLSAAGVTLAQLSVMQRVMDRHVSDRDASVTAKSATNHSPSKSAIRSKRYRANKKAKAGAPKRDGDTHETVTRHVTPLNEPLYINTIPISQKDSEKEDSSKTNTREGKAKRGTRISPDFTPDAGCEKLARELKFSRSEWDNTLAEFKDFWAGVPGQRGCKLDWQATFRCRLRVVAGNRRPINGHSRPQNALDRLRAEIRAETAALGEDDSGEDFKLLSASG